MLVGLWLGLFGEVVAHCVDALEYVVAFFRGLAGVSCLLAFVGLFWLAGVLGDAGGVVEVEGGVGVAGDGPFLFVE